MATMKSIIVNDVPTTLTAVYTNNTAGDAAIKAVNFSHTALETDYTSVDQSGDVWTYMGSGHSLHTTLSGSAGSAEGNARYIKITDDKVLAIYPPFESRHLESTGTCEMNVIEYTGTVYRAGPMQTMTFPYYSFNNGGSSFQSFMLNATQAIVVTTSSTSVYLFTFSGNTVSSINSLSVNGTFNGGSLGVAPVGDDPTKFIVFGRSSNNAVAQAYSVSGTTITAVGSSLLLNSGSWNGQQGMGFCNTAIGVNKYYWVFSASSSSYHGTFSFTSATNTLTAITSNTSVSHGTTAYTHAAVCLATGSTENFAWSYSDTTVTASGSMLRRHTDSAALSTGVITTNTYDGTNNGGRVHDILKLKDGVYILAGHGHVYISQTLTVVFNPGQYRSSNPIPFGSKPVFFDSNGTPLAYTGVSATGTAPSTTTTGCYVPYGPPDGRKWIWSDTFQGYITGFGAALYVIGRDGSIIKEQWVPTTTERIDAIALSPTHQLVYLSCSWGMSGYSSNPFNQTASGYVYLRGSSTALTADNWGSLSLTQLGSTAQYGRYGSSVTFYTAADGSSRVAFAYSWYNQANAFQYIGLGECSISSSALDITVSALQCSSSGSPNSYRDQAFIIPEGTSSTYPYGTFSLYYYNNNSARYIRYRYSYGAAVNGAGSGSATSSANLSAVLSTGQHVRSAYVCNSGWRAVLYGSVGTGTNVIASKDARLVLDAKSLASGYGACNAATLKSGLLALGYSGGNPGTPLAGSVKFFTGSGAEVTAMSQTITSSRLSPTLHDTGAYTFVSGIAGEYKTITYYGAVTSGARMVLSDGTVDFQLTPFAGVDVAVQATSRSSDVYYMPPGYSLKVAQSVPGQLDALITVLEEA